MNKYQKALLAIKKIVIDERADGFYHPRTVADFYCDDVDILQELVDNPPLNQWIPVEERLPEGKINPYTMDYYMYPVIFDLCNLTDVRYYSFGKGHWYQNGEIMDQYVKAWMPLPEAFRNKGVVI